MKEIIINSKRYGVLKAKVDDQDYDRLKCFNWNISLSKGNLYVTCRQFFPDDKKRKVKMHQVVMMPYDNTKFVVDHKDNDALNNQRENLRLATFQQNSHNRRPLKNKLSKFKGVSFFQNGYTVAIVKDGKKIYGGRFKNELDAAKHWNSLAMEHHGEFAYQNPV